MSQETSATISDDELAGLYLQGRDVDCPSCGYNRRDGKDSRCPECGCAIALRAYDQENPLDPQRMIRLGLLVLVLFVACMVIANTASLISALVYESVPVTLFWGIWYFGGHIFWMFMLYWTVRLWSKSRKGKVMMSRHFCRPAIAVLIMTLIGVVLNVYNTVMVLISVL